MGRFFGIVSDNDLYVDGHDRHYTAGTHIAYAFARGKAPHFLSWLSRFSPLDQGPASREIQIGLGQVISTPEDLSRMTADPRDRPYSGWLYANLSATTRDTRREDEVGFSIGLIGPASLAEDAHELLHEVTGSIDPQGWDTQLDNEPALQVHFRRSWFVPVKPDDVYEGDLIPRIQAVVGNVYTEIDLGLAWRFGSYVPAIDKPMRGAAGIANSAPRFAARRDEIDWMFRADVIARAVAHNVFLDGSVFNDEDLTVDSRTFAWEASAGVQFTFGNFAVPIALAFSYVWRAKEFDDQSGPNRFGSIEISTQF